MIKIEELQLQISNDSAAAVSGIDALRKSLNSLRNSAKKGTGLDKVSAEISSFRDSLPAEIKIPTIKNDSYSEIKNQFSEANKIIEENTRIIEDAGVEYEKTAQKSAAASSKTQDGLDKVKESVKSVKKETEKSNSAVGKFFKSITRIAGYRLIRTVLKDIGQGFLEGLKHAYAYSEYIDGDIYKALDQISSMSYQIQNQWGAFLGELIVTLQPIINMVNSGLLAVGDFLTQVMSAVNGDNTYKKANYVAKQWDDATDSAKKYKDYVLGFDELNIFSDNKSGKGSSLGWTVEEDYNLEQIGDTAKSVASVIQWINDHPVSSVATGGLALGLGKALSSAGGIGGLLSGSGLVGISGLAIGAGVAGLFNNIENAQKSMGFLARIGGVDSIGATAADAINAIDGILDPPDTSPLKIALDTAKSMISDFTGWIDTESGVEQGTRSIFDIAPDTPLAKALTEINNITNKVSEKFRNLKKSISDFASENLSLEAIGDKLTEFKTKIDDIILKIKVGLLVVIAFVKSKVDSIHSRISEFKSINDDVASGIKNKVQTVISNIKNMIESIASKISEIVNNIKNNPIVSNVLSSFKIPQFANGGTVPNGQLFWANERGPELVGTVGNKTTVTNQDQFTEGLAEANVGVINAILSMADRIVNSIDGKNLYIGDDDIGKANSRYNHRNGVVTTKGAFANAY